MLKVARGRGVLLRMRLKVALAAGAGASPGDAPPSHPKYRGTDGRTDPARWRWAAAVVPGPGAPGGACGCRPAAAPARNERRNPVPSSRPPPQSPAPQTGSAHRWAKARPSPPSSQSPPTTGARPGTDRAGGKSEGPGRNGTRFPAGNRSWGLKAPGPWGWSAGVAPWGSRWVFGTAGTGRLCPLAHPGFSRRGCVGVWVGNKPPLGSGCGSRLGRAAWAPEGDAGGNPCPQPGSALSRQGFFMVGGGFAPHLPSQRGVFSFSWLGGCAAPVFPTLEMLGQPVSWSNPL